MAGRQNRDYQIKNDFRSSYDLIRHENHVPHTPLYRPGQEHGLSNRQYYQTRSTNVDDNRTSHDPHRLDLDLLDNKDDEIDPRYGSAKERRENLHHSPGAESTQLYNDQLYLHSNHSPTGGNNSPRSDKGYQHRATGGQTKGSWTERHDERTHDTSRDKPWTHRDLMGSGQVTDPRQGNNRYYGAGGLNGLKHGGALLFIRFPTGSGPGRTDNIAVASQAFLRSKTIDMGGKFLGIAKTVHDFGYHSGQKEAIALYHFPNTEKAKLFFQYDPIIRQPDFPPPYGHAEMWVVCNAYLPDNLDEYNTFLLSEVMLHKGYEKREFFEIFQKPFEKYLSENEVMPYVVCSYGPHDRESLRRHAYHHQAVVTCHLFKGLNHLKWLSDQDMYLKFRSLHNQMAAERCMVFSIERNLCP